MLSQSAVHFGQPQSGASREGGSAWEVGSSWEVEDSRGSGECEAPERVLQVPLWMGWRDESDAEDIFFASIHGEALAGGAGWELECGHNRHSGVYSCMGFELCVVKHLMETSTLERELTAKNCVSSE